MGPYLVTLLSVSSNRSSPVVIFSLTIMTPLVFPSSPVLSTDLHFNCPFRVSIVRLQWDLGCRRRIIFPTGARSWEEGEMNVRQL